MSENNTEAPDEFHPSPPRATTRELVFTSSSDEDAPPTGSPIQQNRRDSSLATTAADAPVQAPNEEVATEQDNAEEEEETGGPSTPPTVRPTRRIPAGPFDPTVTHTAHLIVRKGDISRNPTRGGVSLNIKFLPSEGFEVFKAKVLTEYDRIPEMVGTTLISEDIHFKKAKGNDKKFPGSRERDRNEFLVEFYLCKAQRRSPRGSSLLIQ